VYFYVISRRFWVSLALGLGLVWLAACAAPQVKQPEVNVVVETNISAAQGATAVPPQVSVRLPAGSTVEEALNEAEIPLEALDRVDPPLYTVLREGMRIRVVRVEERFDVQEVVLPFERQTVRNQNLTEGETRLVQAGENGLQEVTYRSVLENGVEIARNQVKTVVIKAPLAEIIMVGSQQPFITLTIPGRLAYLTGGNAWIMEGDTANRRPLVTNGKLDGRIFTLSADGNWLLFTQRAEKDANINSLYAIPTTGKGEDELPLGVDNVVHFAEWVPGATLRVAYSTVEPRSTAPGWQANNDLFVLDFSANGWVSDAVELLSAGSGGVYGWWGSEFKWSPDGAQVAYVRADEIGLVNLEEKNQQPLLAFTPYQTLGDWAWVPGVSWSPDGKMLYVVLHNDQGNLETAETSPVFDVAALTMEGTVVPLVSQAGMFAYPVPSPLEKEVSGEKAFRMAYLQAVFPNQSQTSRYRLMVVDRDGSNKQEVFPPEGMPGMEPQRVFWSPGGVQPKNGSEGQKASPVLALLYQGDMWFADAKTGTAQQITGEGVVSRIDWK